MLRRRPFIPASFQRRLLSTVPRPEAVATKNGVKTTMIQAINAALDLAMKKNDKVVCFGDDVGFGGVFRCTQDLRDKYGAERVFNSPLTEQGIAAFGIGMAVAGWSPVAEIQFADYIFPAFDQIVNEAAKFRYRSGGQFNCGGLVIRSPCSSVGHGGLYHSQSVEAFFSHSAGLKIVMPSTAGDAKGLLLQCIEEPDPCLFFEPKILYRSAVEDVNPEYYTIPLGKGRLVLEGKDVTIVTYGSQVRVAQKAAEMAKAEGIDVELIDLRSIIPWDHDLVYDSVRKTGRVIITHEAQQTSGFGAELVASIARDCFLHLESPPMRVCGLDTPFPIKERVWLPNELKLVEAIRSVMNF